LRLARQRIVEGLANKAVAAELGFANESHLCHEFKRAYGTSPQAFFPLHNPSIHRSKVSPQHPTTAAVSPRYPGQPSVDQCCRNGAPQTQADKNL
jgi:AraC-like DNA-binding protein